MYTNRIEFRRLCTRFKDEFIEKYQELYKKGYIYWKVEYERYSFFIESKKVFTLRFVPNDYIIDVQNEEQEYDDVFCLNIWSLFSTFLTRENRHFLVRNVMKGEMEYIGEKGEKVLDMLSLIPHVYRQADEGYIELHEHTLFPFFYLWINLKKEPTILCGLNLENVLEEWHTKEEVEKFLTRLDKEEKRMLELPSEVVNLVKRYDPSAYFHQHEEVIYLFGESFYIDMEKCFDEDQDLYNYHIESTIGEYEADDLEETISLFKQELESYLKKERILRSTRGETVNILPRFFYELFEEEAPVFETNYDEQQLNAYLLSLKNWQIKPYQNGYKVGELYVYKIEKIIKIEKEKSLV